MLSSGDFLRFRKEVFFRDNCFCAACGAEPPLNAYRIEREMGFVLENGISLCQECSAQAGGPCLSQEKMYGLIRGKQK
jgi:hypothetical protein